MKYNTQEKALPMPEYGRAVQKMVDHAVTIEDRAERQRCANTIIAVMGNMFPQLRDVAEFKHKLWDHLAVMADFKLDIDYPCEVIKPEEFHIAPQRVPYRDGEIRTRHYGRIVEGMIAHAMTLEEGEEKECFVELILIQMKKNYIAWNKDGVEDQKIFEDLRIYTKGAIDITDREIRINANNQRGNNTNNKTDGCGACRHNTKGY